MRSMDPSRSVRGDGGSPRVDGGVDGAADRGGVADGPTSGDGDPSPLSSVLLPRILGVPVLTVVLLTFAVAVVLGNYLPTMADAAATHRALDRQEERNALLGRRIQALEEEALALDQDPWVNERILRDELKMTRPGEVPLK